MYKMPARYGLLILPKPAKRLPADCDPVCRPGTALVFLLDAGGHGEEHSCAPPLRGRI
jgi:hypothetical protein